MSLGDEVSSMRWVGAIDPSPSVARRDERGSQYLKFIK